MPAQRQQTLSAPHHVISPQAEPLDTPLVSFYGIFSALVCFTLRVTLQFIACRATRRLHLVVVLLADQVYNLARYRTHTAGVNSQRAAVIGQHDQALECLDVGPNNGLGALVRRCCSRRRRCREGRLRRSVSGAPSAARLQPPHADERRSIIRHAEQQARHQVARRVVRVAVLEDGAPRGHLRHEVAHGCDA